MRSRFSLWRGGGGTFRRVPPRQLLNVTRPRKLGLEPLEERALLDAVGLSPGGSFAGDDLFEFADLGAADHPLSEMFEVPSDVAGQEAYVPGEILIKFRQQAVASLSVGETITWDTDLTGAPPADGSLSAVLSAYSATSLAPVFPRLVQEQLVLANLLAEGETPVESPQDADRADLARWYRVELPPEADVEAALAAFDAAAEVAYAEPNYEYGLAYEIPPVIEGLPDGTTDPDYDEQWFHTNAKVPNAWDYLNRNGVYPGGVHDVVVAVIDSGVDYTHEELIGNMWVNIDEIPNNGIDDDGNGFVDDIHGASVVSDGRSHSGDPVDFHGHGTHVAGIIAAGAFNGTGGVGVAFNVQIMAIRAAQYSGVLTTQDISEGILYAVDNGAEVISMSFGGYQYSQIMVDALEMALNQAVLVAAAGNDGAPIPMYPARLPYVLGIMASTPDDKKAWFSNAGDIMAPGVSIYSTLPGNSYAAWSGTSMATPLVSGVAALMRSFFWQRDIYSSRFIMGSIYASASGGVSSTPTRP